MTLARFTALVLLLSTLGPVETLAQAAPSAAAATADARGEFVSVPLTGESSVNGKTLMSVAYGVILGLFLLYGISLVTRERAVERALCQLKERLENRHRTKTPH
jgi:hypothetical protein